ncbi:hypothetical protein HMPREF1861_00240 [Corynebacterium kroppenstedtii]|nr:hypothetical protein HMPREF1861_00240 [Corynebacterium kroppenstedtii]
MMILGMITQIIAGPANLSVSQLTMCLTTSLVVNQNLKCHLMKILQPTNSLSLSSVHGDGVTFIP